MSKQNRTKLLLDISTFAAFLIAMDPHTSGADDHFYCCGDLFECGEVVWQGENS